MLEMIARRRSLALALALTLLASMAVVTAARAQFLPAVLYGGGLKSGQKVEALINGVSCGTTTASAKGEWILQVPVEAPCKPKAGNPIAFKIDGAEATSAPAATWESGGIPTGSVKTGYTLTVGGGGNNAGSSSGDASEDGDGGSSPVIFIAVGAVLLAAVAAGGWFMYQRRGGA